jgi:nitroreductase/FMN reductase [NAD(P)H]
MEATLESLLADRFGEAATRVDAPVTPMLARILARRTQRNYTADPVPDGLVDLLLFSALSASSKSDFQQASIIKRTDAGRRERASRLLVGLCRGCHSGGRRG